MWKAVCQQCEWHSGETYLKSVAESIGKVHQEDHAGHMVTLEEVSGLDWTGTPKPPASGESAS